MKKRHCLMCGQNFSFDLGIHFEDGYICSRCQREGPPPAPLPDLQTGGSQKILTEIIAPEEIKSCRCT
jgi:hypothetical protein